MKKIALSLLLAALYAGSFAQPGDARHKNYMDQLEKERKEYTQQYIDALRYNRNTPSKTSTAGSTDQSQNLADIFAARAGRETAAQKAAREKLETARYEAYQKQQAEWTANYRATSERDEAIRNSIFLPRYNEYLSAGFTPLDAKVLGNSHVGHRLSADKQRNIYSPAFPPASLRAMEAFKTYQQKQNTAGFEELFDLVTDFNIAPTTVVNALQQMEKRFPEKKELIKASYLFQTASFWGKYNDPGAAPYMFAADDIKKQMLDIYEYGLKTQEAAAIFLASKAERQTTPAKLIIDKYNTKAGFPEALRLSMLVLSTKPEWGKNPELSKFLFHRYNSIFMNPQYKASAADLKQLAAVHQVTPGAVVQWLNDATWEYDRVRYDASYGFVPPFRQSYSKNGFDLALKELGEAGDMNSLNVYALGVAFGMSKEKPKNAMNMFKRAADGGSPYALFNLIEADRWGTKWYSKDDLKEALARLKTFKLAPGEDKSLLPYYFDMEKGVRLRW
ncbi:MAG: hypothetical protein EOO06_08205 [Chitinophagaceae bacterium]|nr:MAG: hypothetical protein EOO06_08205 [Chitinophagaceae bacterium]